MEEVYTTRQAADRLGVTVRRVQAMLQAKRLKGRKIGRDWLVDRQSLERVAKEDRQAGRPAKKPDKSQKGRE